MMEDDNSTLISGDSYSSESWIRWRQEICNLSEVDSSVAEGVDSPCSVARSLSEFPDKYSDEITESDQRNMSQRARQDDLLYGSLDLKEKYERLKNALEDMKRELKGAKMNEINARGVIQDLRITLKKTSKENDENVRDMLGLIHKCEKLQTQNKVLRDENESLQEANKKAKRTIDDLMRQIEEKGSEWERLFDRKQSKWNKERQKRNDEIDRLKEHLRLVHEECQVEATYSYHGKDETTISMSMNCTREKEAVDEILEKMHARKNNRKEFVRERRRMAKKIGNNRGATLPSSSLSRRSRQRQTYGKNPKSDFVYLPALSPTNHNETESGNSVLPSKHVKSRKSKKHHYTSSLYASENAHGSYQPLDRPIIKDLESGKPDQNFGWANFPSDQEELVDKMAIPYFGDEEQDEEDDDRQEVKKHCMNNALFEFSTDIPELHLKPCFSSKSSYSKQMTVCDTKLKVQASNKLLSQSSNAINTDKETTPPVNSATASASFLSSSRRDGKSLAYDGSKVVKVEIEELKQADETQRRRVSMREKLEILKMLQKHVATGTQAPDTGSTVDGDSIEPLLF